MKILIYSTLLIVFALFFSCEPIPEVYDYDDWDKDTSGALSKDEFQAYAEYSEYFKELDENEDGVLDTEEFSNHLEEDYKKEVNNQSLQDWDTNQDNGISEDEFINKSFEMWDDNNDGQINKDEYSKYKFGELP